MTTDRKAELAAMCRLEVKRTAAIVRMTLNGRDLYGADVVDFEFWRMLTRLRDKPTTQSDLRLLRELVETELIDGG
jgi:hypothetical protein